MIPALRSFPLLTLSLLVRCVRIGAGLAALLAGNALAVQPAGDANAAWPVFQTAEVHEQTRQVRQALEFPLGPIRRELDGHIGPNPSERVSGQLSAQTYQVSGAFTTSEIFAFFEQQATLRGFQTRYRCDSFQCGRSSFWANNYFGVANLFGPDRNQHLLAASRSDSGVQRYLVVYVVERANRRIFYHLAELVSDAAVPGAASTSAADLLRSLEQLARVVLPGLTFDAQGQLQADPAQLALIKELIALNGLRAAALVGHDRSPQGSVAERTERSRYMAQQVAQALGAAAQDLAVQGVGPLAPVSPTPGERWVELVRTE